MPIKQAAKKYLRQSQKRSLNNLKIKRKIKDLVKKSDKLMVAKDLENSSVKVKAAIKKIDRAIKKGILKKNTGARKKSQLIKRLNLLKK